MYSVYKHTSPNGKVYIGITKQTPEMRWQNGLGYKTQTKFYRAIVKYGWDNFSHEILYSDLTLEEAEMRERELISQYKSYDNDFGYNVEMGGSYRKVVSEETIEKLRRSHTTPEYLEWMRQKNEKRWSDPAEHEKMSKRFAGEKNPMFGRKLTEEHKQILSQYKHRPPVHYGEDNYWFGKHHTDEMKARIGQAHRGEKNHRARRVRCVETGFVYGSIRDAYRETGVRFDSISGCCRGITNTAGGYHWQYVDETEV